MAGQVRKENNPGPVDAWLDTLGFYRKNVAYDETCLFRAVSEQLFSCQIHHERCREELIEDGRSNYDQFNWLMTKEKFLERLSQLKVHMVVCGNIELQIISKKYKKDVVVFNGNTKQVAKIGPSHYEETLRLCLRGEDHYDAVYKKDYMQTAGFCQSIVYGLVYENVFNITNVPKIVHTMLHEKTDLAVTNSEVQDGSVEGANEKSNSSDSTRNKHSFDDYENMLQTNVTPFSFKVAKALDENIYRNIEYDTWRETWKELRLGQWYYGDNNLIVGTCCLLTTDEGVLQCYIQDMNRAKDECIVYITSLAEKRIVTYSELAPEANAKPWPLPNRFVRNTNAMESPFQVKPFNANRGMPFPSHILRRRWHNKHNQRCSTMDNVPTLMPLVKPDVHMQQPTQSCEPDTTQATDDHQNVDYSMDGLAETHDETHPELRLGQWNYGDNNLMVGTCCLLTTDEGDLQCYIQDINRAKDECVVYITSLAEKRTVSYSKLASKADAKPWPLPARFLRNVTAVESPSQVKPVNANRSMPFPSHILRRRWHSKYNQRCSTTDNVPTLMPLAKPHLRVQQPTQSYELDTRQAIVNQQNVDYSVNGLAETQNEIYPATHSTPLFTQHIQPRAITINPQQEHAQRNPQQEHAQRNPQQEHAQRNPHQMLVSSNRFPCHCEHLRQSVLVPITPLVPMSPYYPAIYPNIGPASPIICRPTYERQNVVIFSPPTVGTYTGFYSPQYNPPIDMSFMRPSFIYPSAPPAWYRPSPVDAQGFIFPTLVFPWGYERPFE